MRDIPFELEHYHIDNNRWPQFFTDFYEGMKQTLHDLADNLSHLPEALCSLIVQHPHYNDEAHVRYSESDDICQEEKTFIDSRMPHVKKNLEKILHVKLNDDQVPKIGLVFSGGGFRAMLMTLGFLCGAQDIGLLDCSMYTVGLSGSTWAIAPWIASERPLKEFTFELRHKLYNGIDHINDPYELSELLEIVVTKLISRQFVATMDIYGGVIANTLLKGFLKNPMLTRLTESHERIKNGCLPLPIYTAIQSYQDPYEWMEFSPFEVGSSFLKAYVPTWAYGRKFKNGISVDRAPEQTLGYFMGVFGSAFEVNLKDIVHMSASNLSYLGHKLPEFLANALKKTLDLILASIIGDLRLFPSMLLNFTFGCNDSPIKDDKTISLVDAGIDCNLPFHPLLRPARNMDIIIVYDASAGVQGAPELVRAQDYAKRNGLKFPPIDFEVIDQQIVSVFKDPTDPTTPIVVYFPRIKNNNYSTSFDPDYCVEHDYCNTFNFQYSPEEAKLLTSFAEFSIKEQQGVIKKTIYDVLIEKYDYRDNSLLDNAIDITGIA